MFNIYQPVESNNIQQVGGPIVQSNQPGLLTSGHTSLYLSVAATALLVLIYFTVPKKGL